MRISETPLAGAWLIEAVPQADARGAFARVYCADTLSCAGIDPKISQCSISWNPKRGTLRGMHFQLAPHAENKLVRVTRGGIFDVIADIRPSSATYGQWFGTELTADNRRSLFIPKGFAHGFLSLCDETEVYYMISEPYAPGSGAGICWNDPDIGIVWPFDPLVISERDASYPTLATLHKA